MYILDGGDFGQRLVISVSAIKYSKGILVRVANSVAFVLPHRSVSLVLCYSQVPLNFRKCL